MIKPLATDLIDKERNSLSRVIALTLSFAALKEILSQQEVVDVSQAESPDPDDVERANANHERAVKGKLRSVEYWLRLKALQVKNYRQSGPLGIDREPGLRHDY